MEDPTTLRHVRPVQPLAFHLANPEWLLGQSTRHLYLCELLHRILRAAVTPEDSVGADLFVYYDATNPKKCLAPDGFVKLGVRQELFPSWKVWERGAPELCVEIVSPSDQEPIDIDEKLARYRALGSREVVVFDVEAAPGKRVRAFDRIADDFVERIVDGDSTPCLTLSMWWVVSAAPDLPVALRLARDAGGRELIATPEETVERLRAELARR